MGRALGLLLAAGAGERMGGPKALVRDRAGVPLVARALSALVGGGCDEVVVVLGARAEDAEAVVAQAAECLPAPVRAVAAPDWIRGMARSLAAGLDTAAGSDARCAVITLVDLPDVGPDVVSRVLHQAGSSSRALARAAYRGRAGHPVVVGREHWVAMAHAATGDRGGSAYLGTRRHRLIECGDLATGQDVDRPADLR